MAPTWLLVLATPIILWVVMGYRIDRNTHARTLAELETKRG